MSWQPIKSAPALLTTTARAIENFAGATTRSRRRRYSPPTSANSRLIAGSFWGSLVFLELGFGRGFSRLRSQFDSAPGHICQEGVSAEIDQKPAVGAVERVNDPVRMQRGCGNVFRDLGFPEGEAHVLALRSELMISIERVVKQSRLTQTAAARRLGIAQRRLRALLRGKLGQFNLDALVTIATRAGLRVELLARPSHRRNRHSRCVRCPTGSMRPPESQLQ